uniref:Bm1604 n=1 Tax=Brugia malayi TaxID=6279 RepID=A0A0J9Y7Y5_BRUMA|nr:Bm1604 [Brugia malayi]
MLDEHGVCRKICKKSSKELKILESIFCKKKAVTQIKYDFSTRNCSQTFRQHQLCLIENISYDNSSDAFSVRLKLYRCRKMQTMQKGKIQLC